MCIANIKRLTNENDYLVLSVWLAPDDNWKLSTPKIGSLDTVLSGAIIDINVHPIIFCTTPEILQNSIEEVSRSKIYKTEIQADIVIILKRYNLQTRIIGRDIAKSYFKSIKRWNL